MDPHTAADRHAIEEQLRAAEARLRVLVDDAADAIFITDAAGHYLDVNPAGCAIFGYTLDEMLSLSVRNVVTPEEYARLDDELARLMDGTPVRGR